MAVVSTSVALHMQQQRMERPGLARGLSSSASVRSTSSSASVRSASSGRSLQEIEEVPMDTQEEEKVYVALPKEFKEGKTLLGWVFRNIHRENKVVIAHVHRPSQMIPMMGGWFPASKLMDQEVKAYRQLERDRMNKSLDEYLALCSKLKFQAEKVVIEMDDVSKGLVELITQHEIIKLVMGAAADKHYSKKMKGPKSKTAITVQQLADPSCNIWFVCRGNLICTRDGGLDGSGMEYSPTTSPSSASSRPEQLRSRSLPQARGGSSNWLSNPVQDLLIKHRSRSEHFDPHARGIPSKVPSGGLLGTPKPGSSSSTEGISVDPWEGILRSSQASDPSSSSLSEELVGKSGALSTPRYEDSDVGSLMLPLVHESEEDLQFSTAADELEHCEIDDEVYSKLQHALTDAENSRREAYEESCQRMKAERDVIKAEQKARASENLYAKEVKQRKEIEEKLAREKMELESLRKQRNEVFVELREAQAQKQELELRIAESNRTVKDYDEKLSAAQFLLGSLKREHEELQRERDDAVREAEELRHMNREATTSNTGALNFSTFSYSELAQATENFKDSFKIGEGGYGSVYKGSLRHTSVAIKMLNPQGKQGLSEFHQEVDVLSRVRHPNLVTLIGTCPEAGALIYEFLQGGSLEDRLTQKDNTPPLSWRVRTRIAAEICAALIFLHSSKPHSVVHGDLKPGNILLDANYVSKLADFGICRLLAQSNSTTTLYRYTHPKGTFVYMDPEFLSTGELTPRSDVYSYGVIILRLLTGRPALGLIKDVRDALGKGCLHEILDTSAGEWPYLQAKQLAQLGLKCCEIKRKSRPDLTREAWKVLEYLLKAASSTGAAPLPFASVADENRSIPSYFICPIFQEVMKEPHIAADGYTYEAEAIKGWIDSGHDTSPMTNLQLEHCELIPNHALRSAIQEWLQQQK